MPHRLTGLIAAAVTPMDAEGGLRLEIIDALAELYVESGVAGVFACGTTGECHSLATSERKGVAERWMSASQGRFPVVVHVGHNSLPEAQELAAHAAECGAAAVAAMAPFFFKPADVAALADYCARIAAAAPETPFYFYHIPGMTGVSLPVAEFLRQAAPNIPDLAGVKFTSTNLHDYQECLAVAEGRFDLLFGHDEILLAGLALGAKGAIGSTYNFAAPVYRRIMSAFEAGDLETARREQSLAAAMVRVLLDFGGVPACKAIMQLIGIDCGPPRSPLRPLSESEVAALCDALQPFDVFARPLASAG
ncbi:MAG: dihydrodipicolinate synthase family protein [Planctomycetes bacterium]|nr:dihydrodipicolinate synthase family protein [Planctomycetota bacterium]